jgi:hypothetical protein
VIIPKEERSHTNLFYRKLYRVWWHMNQRCYNPKRHDYKYYGAKGVHICDKWRQVDGFLEDVDYIEGWDKEKFSQGRLFLDKDLMFKGNNRYYLEGCTWVSRERNMSYIPSKMQDIVACNPEGKLIEFSNTTVFAREHKLNINAITQCLLHGQAHHHGWQFCYKKDYHNRVFKSYEELHSAVIALSPEGDLVKFKNAQEAANRIIKGYSGNVSEAIEGKTAHVKGWQISRLEDYYEGKFVDPKTLKGVRGRNITATSPQGHIYKFSDRKAFEATHGVDARRIAECVNGKRKEYKGWTFKFSN